ncbi:protein SMALL AUXIN UP-REGULATED RNA 51 [Physcomitrium patens]|uniref:Uncharacterized protein n=1 Tax=Physcomitrium patens TaxID=3218 RepID=A0A2K1JPT4_PHYPA|nr:auxin-responsive protein SAUR50-like [Physcomitrium patens]PNR43521.1 hypothetical protein PHYPA_015902 [Physcomitrium patens]|eukprot:XP_024390203.1 auxin-responsive protein SAUR50-like [Physcomitrella patens]
MMSGKKIGKLVQKYMRVESFRDSDNLDRSSPRSLKRWSGRASSFSSSTSNRGSGRSLERGNGPQSDCWDEDAPEDVPSGSLAVYVGPKRRRFVIQTSFLYTRVFRELLRRSEEEYGFETEGGLRIACEAGNFEKLLWQLETSGNSDESF